jgi:ribose transport system permease protein
MSLTVNDSARITKKRVVIFVLNNVVWLIFITLMVGFSVFIKGFFSVENYRNILYHSVFIGMLAIAETLILISGNMDLSVESTAAFAAIISVWLCGASSTTSGLLLNSWLGILIIIIAGGLVGAFNAFFILKLKINSFLVTLATYVTLRGLAVLISKGYGMSELPDSFRFINTVEFLTLPLMVFLLFFFYIFFEFILKNTQFGRHIYVIGGNVNAAYNFGINVNKVLLKVFVLSGIISAITGWLMAARVNGANAGIGSGYLFEVLAAVVIGGVGLSGGFGSLVGVFAGSLILSAIHNAINISAISPFYTTVIRGGLIFVAIALDSLKRIFR